MAALDLAAIQAFVTVGDLSGFRAASDALGMTASGVSKAVSRLEARLGVQLIVRTTRSVRLTTAGSSFHTRCKAILADLGEAEHAASGEARQPRGNLRISAPLSYGRTALLPLLLEYRQLYPDVEVTLRLEDRYVDLVSEGVDLAVRMAHLPDSGMVAARLASASFVCCGAPRYLASMGVPHHPDDLARHRSVEFVAPRSATRFEWRFLVDEAVRHVTPKGMLTVDDSEAQVLAAVAGEGLIWVHDYIVASQMRRGELMPLLTPFQLPAVPISVVHPPSRHPSAAASALIGLMRRRLRAS